MIYKCGLTKLKSVDRKLNSREHDKHRPLDIHQIRTYYEKRRFPFQPE
jgi:hypothetical protein